MKVSNPLVFGLDKFTDTQLEDRITDLQKKYFQTNNPGLQMQIAGVIDNYKEELYTRRAIAAQKQREQQGDDENGLDSLINIS